MKNLLILLLFACAIGWSQDRPIRADVVFLDTLTTTERDALTMRPSQFALIANSTVDSVQAWIVDKWVNLGSTGSGETYTFGTGLTNTSGTITVTNPFEEADETKLDGIETNATEDQSDAEISTAFLNENPNTDLDGSGTSVTAGTNVTVTGSGTSGSPYVINSTASGTGDVTGPASSTDNAIVRFDATTGKIIQNSVVTIGDTGNADFGGGSLTDIGQIDVNTEISAWNIQLQRPDGLAGDAFIELNDNNGNANVLFNDQSNSNKLTYTNAETAQTIVIDDLSATDDQTGAEVLLTGYSKGSDGTAVAATDNANEAIAKLENQIEDAVISGGGVTTEQAEKLANLRKVNIVEVTGDITLNSSHFLPTTPNRGKRTLLKVKSDAVISLPTGLTDSVAIEIAIDSIGAVAEIQAASGVTLIGRDINKEILNNGYQVDSLETTRLLLTAQDTFRVDGYFKKLDWVSALYNGQNPADPNNETSDVSMVVFPTSGTATSTTARSTEGTRAIRVNSTAVQDIEIPLQNITTGDAIELTVDVYAEEVDGAAYVWLKVGDGWNGPDVEDVTYVEIARSANDNDEWQTITVEAVASEDNPSLFLSFGNNETLDVDNIRYIKTN